MTTAYTGIMQKTALTYRLCRRDIDKDLVIMSHCSITYFVLNVPHLLSSSLERCPPVGRTQELFQGRLVAPLNAVLDGR